MRLWDPGEQSEQKDVVPMELGEAEGKEIQNGAEAETGVAFTVGEDFLFGSTYLPPGTPGMWNLFQKLHMKKVHSGFLGWSNPNHMGNGWGQGPP